MNTNDVLKKYPNLNGAVYMEGDNNELVVLLQGRFDYGINSIEILGIYFNLDKIEIYKIFEENDFVSINDETFSSEEKADMMMLMVIEFMRKKFKIAESSYSVSSVVIKKLYTKMRLEAVKKLRPEEEMKKLSSDEFEAIKKWGKGFSS